MTLLSRSLFMAVLTCFSKLYRYFHALKKDVETEVRVNAYFYSRSCTHNYEMAHFTSNSTVELKRLYQCYHVALYLYNRERYRYKTDVALHFKTDVKAENGFVYKTFTFAAINTCNAREITRN